MIEQTILSSRSNCKKVSSDLKNLWIRDILLQCGLNLEKCYNLENDEWEEQTIEQKSNLRKVLKENDILVIDEDENCKIYVQDTIIGEWTKPTYTLKRDLSIIEKSKQFYIEIGIKFSSVFDTE